MSINQENNMKVYNKKINIFQHVKNMLNTSDDNFWTRVYEPMINKPLAV